MQLNSSDFEVKETGISIHAPYKGCNADMAWTMDFNRIFQSMHPIKDATLAY